MLFQYMLRAFRRSKQPPRDEAWRREEVPGAKRFQRAADDSSKQTGSRESNAPQATDTRPNVFRLKSRKALVIGAVALGIGSTGYFALSDGAEVPSRLARVPPMDTTPGGQRQRESERYQETLQVANELNADNAVRAGNSFIPIPEDLTESINPPLEVGTAPWSNRPPDVLDRAPPQVPSALDSDPEKGAKMNPIENAVEALPPLIVPISDGDQGKMLDSAFAAGRVRTSGSVPTSGSPNVQEADGRSNGLGKADNPYRSAIIGQMNAIARGLAVRPPRSEILIANGQYSNNARSNDGMNSSAQASEVARTDGRIGGRRPSDRTEKEVSTGSVRISAGTVLYGETLNAADSDNPAPIVVEVSQGTNKGLRLVGRGTATAYSDGFAIEFDTLVNLDGAMQPVSAIGLDGYDGDLAVASGKDLRIFERYGPILASSFIAGYARSAARTGSTTVVANGSAIVATEKPTSKEHLYSALGEAGGHLATDLATNAPKGPKIMLEAGHPIGILFVETVDIDSSAWR